MEFNVKTNVRTTILLTIGVGWLQVPGIIASPKINLTYIFGLFFDKILVNEINHEIKSDFEELICKERLVFKSDLHLKNLVLMALF